jgi:hypothetical protein
MVEPHFSIWRESTTATVANSERSAVRRSRFARSHAISTRPLVILRVPSLGPRPSSNQGAQEDREAVRTLEAHPETRSITIARPERRPGRVCSGRHCSKPATTCIVGRSAATRWAPVYCVALELRRASGPVDQSRLLQRVDVHRNQPTFATKSATSRRLAS